MKKCPNKSYKSTPTQKKSDWQILVDGVGEIKAMSIFMVKEELPEIDEIYLLIEDYNKKLAERHEEDQKAIKNIIEELQEVDKNVIVKSVDEFFHVISNHLKNLKQRKSYERLKKIFTNQENINKFSVLEDLLKQADKAEEDIEGDRKRIRALAQGIVQMDFFMDLIIEDAKSLLKDNSDSIENLHTIQAYLNTTNDWNIFLSLSSQTFAIGNSKITKKIAEVREKINQLDSLIQKNDENAIVSVLQSVLIPSSKSFLQGKEKEIEKQKEILKRQQERNADSNTLEKTKQKIKSLEQDIEKYDFEKSQNVLDFLKGKRGDASVFNTWAESWRDSSDPTISGFADFIKNQLDQANTRAYKWDLQYQKELAPLIKESERLNPASLNSKITFKDKVKINGKLEEELVLLNPHKDYRYDYQNYIDKEQELKDKYLETNTEEDKQNYLQAKKDRQKFEENYMYREYTDDFYKKYKFFDDEIGQDLKKDIDQIFEKLNQNKQSFDTYGIDFTPEQEAENERLWLEYKLLGNINKADGTPKEGVELEKAERMKEVRKYNRELYDFIDNLTMFEKAKERYSEQILSENKDLDEDSPEYKLKMLEWEKKNTRIVIKDEFYKERDKIIREIDLLVKKFKNEGINEDIKKSWDEIMSITYGLRDENNYPMGFLIQEKGAERIKDALLNIENLRKKLTKINGLTNEEQARLSELFEKSRNGQIKLEEREELDDILEKSKISGLNDVQKKRLFKLFEDLKDLQSNLPTEYYIQIFNDISTRYGKVLLEDGTISENGKIVPILESQSLKELLKNDDFEQWFKLNHYEVERFNVETKELEKQWKRSYQWNKIVPNNKDFYEVKPSAKYTYRQVKKQYVTEKIIGKTVDNKGNFLPNLSKSDKYKNQDYFNLINSSDSESKRLSSILQIHTKHLLNAQEDLIRENKLYLTVPKRERESYEKNIETGKKVLKNPTYIINQTKKRVREFYNDLTNFDTTDSQYVPPFEGRYTKDYVKVPQKYISNISADLVSLDLYRNITGYNNSAEVNKQLIESLPIGKALERIIDRTDKNTSKKWYQLDNRKRAIRRIIGANFEGKKSNLETDSKIVLFITNILKKLGAISSIKLNVPSTIANLFNAMVQNQVNAGNELFNYSTYASSLYDYTSRFFPSWQKDIYYNKLGSTSLEGQLIDLWEPVQGTSISEVIGTKSSQSKIYSSINPFSWISKVREYSEFFVQSRTWIAALKEVKVDYNGGVISLLDTYELDNNGIIKLKDGIDASWDFNGENFQILKKKIQALNRKIHGNYAEFDKTQAEMYAVGSISLFLKRYFISMAANRFAAGGSVREYLSLNGKDRFSTHGISPRGFYYHTLQIAKEQISTGLKDWDTLTPQEKISLVKFVKEVSAILMSLLLMSLLGYSGDDKNKKEKIKRYSWLELHILYQLDRFFVESTTFISPASYTNYVLDIQIKSTIEKWFKFFDDFIYDKEYETKAITPKGNILHEKGDKKWKKDLNRALGIEQLLNSNNNPDYLLQTYDKTIRQK